MEEEVLSSTPQWLLHVASGLFQYIDWYWQQIPPHHIPLHARLITNLILPLGFLSGQVAARDLPKCHSTCLAWPFLKDPMISKSTHEFICVKYS